jgi:flavin-dependent dehydrogenase
VGSLGFEVAVTDTFGMALFPTHDDLTLVIVGMADDDFKAARADVEGSVLRFLDLVPGMGERVRSGKREERFRTASDLAGWFRTPYGPGWALVGDAGYFKDPITAHGISDALRDAEFLARAVEQGSEEALARYQSNRDELSRELSEITDTIAGFDWDLDTLKPLHKRLSKVMNEEVDALLGLDGPGAK